MTTQSIPPGLWLRVPLWVRAIISGVLIALVAANVWPILLLNLGALLASIVEALFLAVYVWWASGGGPPQTWQSARAEAFRRRAPSQMPWFWTLVAAFFFAVTVHASTVLLFRIVPFPVAEFRQGYDFSFILAQPLRWLAVVFSALSAGICEETGFRGYMQRPLEAHYGVPVGILTSSIFFTVVHLTKGWALIGMVPIVFGAGVLLGLLAWSSGSLLPGMIGHVLMDIGLFAYWWTGIAGTFTGRPISETGVDGKFVITCLTLAASLYIVLLAISELRRKSCRA
jgi:membrane protease YdiL (CAAX protease family)